MTLVNGTYLEEKINKMKPLLRNKDGCDKVLKHLEQLTVGV